MIMFSEYNGNVYASKDIASIYIDNLRWGNTILK